ncbi:hypothetical protein [Catenuloplanes japonicus]|uniref:hypothetical protein n=1 Tax=Catenuloplanes japonicus TaxID=33876 RepID=UPI000526BDF4|nr:hypothetical protein [Catenuloplanes japonicus]
MTDTFGDPGSVATVATAGGDAGSALEKLTTDVQTGVQTWVREKWTGWAADEMIDYWKRLDRSIVGTGSPLDAYARRMDRASRTMRLARDALAQAERYRAANNLIMTDDLRMISPPGRPEGPALAANGQRIIDAAVSLRDNARRQIAAANRILVTSVSENVGSLLDIVGGIEPPRLGARAGSRPPAGHPGEPRQTTLNRALIRDLETRLDDLGNRKLQAELRLIDPASPTAAGELAALRSRTRTEEILPDLQDRRLDPEDTGVQQRQLTDPVEPESTRSGNFVHRFPDQIKHELDPGPTGIPQFYDAEVASGRLVRISQVPDGLLPEVSLRDGSRMDLVDVVNRKIYEIKSDDFDQVQKALDESAEYAAKANRERFLGYDDWEPIGAIYSKEKAAAYDKRLHED